MKTVGAGTKRIPPPTPTRPPARPPAMQTSTARTSFIGAPPAPRRAGSAAAFEDQIHGHRTQERGEEVGGGALRDPLLDPRAEDDAEPRRDRQQQSRHHVDVAVDAA